MDCNKQSQDDEDTFCFTRLTSPKCHSKNIDNARFWVVSNIGMGVLGGGKNAIYIQGTAINKPTEMIAIVGIIAAMSQTSMRGSVNSVFA